MKFLIGNVIRDSKENTSSVLVERLWEHPVYKKRIKRSTKYLVHTELDVKKGDVVKIAESKPISKNKRWKIVKIIK